ncbi:gamma-glutamylcyclotransferase family protein [Wenyingzhuangia sp. IMCC45574]
MKKVFTYGTLQNPKVQAELFGRLLKGSVDKLKGFKKESILIGRQTYPILTPVQNFKQATIDGVCYELTEEDLYNCDAYEGMEYKRIQVVLDSGTEAWVYIAA